MRCADSTLHICARKKRPDELTAIDMLVSGFGLSTFERSVLLLCAGMELDARFSALCANAQLAPLRFHKPPGVTYAGTASGFAQYTAGPGT